MEKRNITGRVRANHPAPKVDRIPAKANKEIERKYLIREDGNDYPSDALLRMYPSIRALVAEVMQKGKRIRQGYLPVETGKDISSRLMLRVDFSPSEARIREKSGSFFFTLKGEGGLSRNELETEISSDLFESYWALTEGRRVEKVRLARRYKGFTAEIDCYTDRDLIVAEIEFPSEKAAGRIAPLGKDVTEEKRYKNKNLAK